ncbi:S1C family serine protease [Paracidovorax oryzae]|uniref:S1C family serine protease n=1 Tax=Paracidovorax oryzae TaxID=862720 RepID=UPI00031642EA|nr:trypsin-like peptidase domain-containing protein [Paracidovorax oryzae]
MNKSSGLLRLALLVSGLALGGCVTTQGGSASTLPQLQFGKLGLDDISGTIGDAFSPQLRELKKLVGEQKFDEADALFLKEAAYFEKRYKGSDKPLPPEFEQLANQMWETRYRNKADSALNELRGIHSLADKSQWPQISRTLKNSDQVLEAIAADRLLELTHVGSEKRQQLEEQAARVVQLAEAGKAQALESTFEDTLSQGRHSAEFIGRHTFSESDYVGSPRFQTAALAKLASHRSDKDSYYRQAVQLGPYLHEQSRKSIDETYVEIVRRQLMADGHISLDEVSTLGSLRTPFGSGAEALAGLATIGYVDLTSASFRDRNVFDFEIAFKPDLEFRFAPATDSVFASGDISRFDYLFVTDLSVAKVSREFRNKRDNKSRAQTGTQQIQNPDYVTAMASYQKAMAEFQRAQISSAIPKLCSGWGCALQGLADGLANAGARAGVDQASARLAATSQMIDQPVYSEYAYQSVDINTTKTADVNYYVIDVRKKRILRNRFQINDNEVFNVAYNVRDADPEKASIQRNVKTEDEVTAWEKRPMTVPISTLFSSSNLRAAESITYTNMQAFLKTLSTRSYASAAPTYSGLNARSTAALASAPPARAPVGETIADGRFDSVVVIRNAKATGTGFYITPELVLTAYHVVEGQSLVEMTYYDGTKTYGRVIDHDVRLDLALVKAQQAGKPLAIHSGPLKLGETVEAIGHPKGYEFTITRGVISAMRRQRSAAIGSDNLVEFVQTDTPISQGNSGGPLLLKDAVIGVNDWIRVDKGSQNLNFSVSYNEIRSYLDRFKGK